METSMCHFYVAKLPMRKIDFKQSLIIIHKENKNEGSWQTKRTLMRSDN